MSDERKPQAALRDDGGTPSASATLDQLDAFLGEFEEDQETTVPGTGEVEAPQRDEAMATSPPNAPTSIASLLSTALSQWKLIGTTALLVLSLLLSFSALWMAAGLETQLEALNQGVMALEQRLLKQPHSVEPGAPNQLSEQLGLLGERVDELEVIVEGPLSHLRESNRQALQALAMRLARLEQNQKTLTVVKAATSGVSATENPPVRMVASAGVTTAEEAKGGWVINLLSVASAKAANAQLERLRKMGIRADKQSVNKEGKSWYRLRVTGFDSYEGAKAYIDTVERQTGFDSAWVARE